tara:strand:+ start:782 stop:958 length:177 start_codon:yes stop_codon:yes gene_type:complete
MVENAWKTYTEWWAGESGHLWLGTVIQIELRNKGYVTNWEQDYDEDEEDDDQRLIIEW